MNGVADPVWATRLPWVLDEMGKQAEAVRAGQPLPAAFPHDCAPVVYLGDPEPIKHEE